MPLPLARLKGSIPPLLTPFRNGEVDYDTYARLVEMQIAERGGSWVRYGKLTSLGRRYRTD